jgi:hypothetical protein
VLPPHELANATVRRTVEVSASPSAFHHERTQEEGPRWCWPLDLGLASLQNCERDKFLFFINYSQVFCYSTTNGLSSPYEDSWNYTLNGCAFF